MKKLLVLGIAFGFVAACAPPATTINISGGGGDGGAGGEEVTTTTDSTTSSTSTQTVDDSAHAYYVANVHPSLIATCGGCHNPDGQVGAPAFLDYDAELSYPMTKAYPNIVKDPATDSILIKKGPHEGPGVSAEQKTLIETWISKEMSEVGSGGTGGTGGSTGGTTSSAATLEDMLNGFAACMDYDIWLSSGMDKFPLQQTNGDGPCMSCHNTGVGATYLASDPQETFDANKQFPYIMRLVKPVYSGATPVDLVASDRFFNKGKETCQNPPICHPKFDLTPENKAALENFVGVTLTKWQSGQCPKP